MKSIKNKFRNKFRNEFKSKGDLIKNDKKRRIRKRIKRKWIF